MPKPGPEPVEAGAPLEDLVVEEVGALIRASVEGLPEAYRKTMELRFYQGLALQDIAKQLAVPLGTVKARLSRASEMLRQSSAVQATTARLVLDRLKKKQK
jgi:RNA polymerase sigma factor (sigma-70 family)